MFFLRGTDMGVTQIPPKLISASVSFALAWVLSSCWVCVAAAGSDLADPPVIEPSGWPLPRSSNPTALAANESFAFSPDGRTVAAGRSEASRDIDGKLHTSAVVSICDADAHFLWGEIVLPGELGCSVAYSPDGLTLAIGLAREVKLYDPLTRQERATLRSPGTGEFNCLAFSADGRRLAAGSQESVVVWNVYSGRVFAVCSAGAGVVSSVAFSSDGTRLASAAERRGVGQSAVAADSDTSTSRLVAGEVRLWKVLAKAGAQTLELAMPAYAFAFSPDGQTLAIASKDGVRRWGFAELDRGMIAAKPVHCLAYSADGRYLALGTEARNAAR